MISDTGHVVSRMQVDSWGTTFASAHAVSEQVRGALQRYRGSTDIVDIYIASTRTQYDADHRVFGIQHDFTIHHKE